MMRHLWFAALLLPLASSGCGGTPTEVVGGPCAPQSCAPGSLCLTGADFPGGMCVVACSTANPSCPEGSVCVEEEGKNCLPSCSAPQNCRPGYTCKGKKNVVGGGESLVCLK